MGFEVSRRNFLKGAGAVAAGAAAMGLVGCGGSGSKSGGAASGAATSAASTADFVKTNLSYTTFQNENAAVNPGVYLLQDKLNQKMGEGTLTLDYYFSQTLVSNADTLDGVTSGVADIGYMTVGLYPGRLPYASFFDQPGQSWANPVAAANGFEEFVKEYTDEDLKKVKVIMYSVSTPGCFASKNPIRSLADLNGMRVRSAATTSAAVTALGANPVTLEWSECYEALRSGMVDALYTFIGPCSTSLIQEVAPYCTMNPFYTTAYAFIMNLDRYNSFPEAQQKLFDEACAETQAEFIGVYSGVYINSKEGMKYLKDIEELIFLSDEDIQAMSDALAPLMDEYAKSVDGQGLKGTEALAKMKEIAEKWNAKFPGGDYNNYLLSLREMDGPVEWDEAFATNDYLKSLIAVQ